MRTEARIIALALAFGLLLWVGDAIFDYFFFYEGTFLGLMLTGVPPHELYIRSIGLICFLAFGYYLSRVVTKLERVEKEQKELIAELEAKNEELDRYSYSVSHDLKSPLFTISGFLGVLEQDLTEGNTERIQDDIAHITRACQNMERLLNELSEFSRIGRIPHRPEKVPLNQLTREAVGLVAGSILKRGVRVEIAPDLPVVLADRSRLLAALQNLLENAVKFMGDQSRPRVHITARNHEEQAILCVRDNGIGIDPRYQETVFGFFQQLDQNVDGTGMGLALAKQIVERHGGRIWVESEGPGHGSTFCLALPQH